MTRGFDRRVVFTDVGELEHVVGLFHEYRTFPSSLGINEGPWPRLVSALRDYLEHCGVDRDLDASDLIAYAALEQRTDVESAMRALAWLLIHDEPSRWDAETVEVLQVRLLAWYATLAEARAAKADRSAEGARRPRKADKHADWQRWALAVWEKSPRLSKAAVAVLIKRAHKIPETVDAIRRVIQKVGS